MFFTQADQSLLFSPTSEKRSKQTSHLSVNPFEIMEKSFEEEQNRQKNDKYSIDSLNLDYSFISMKSPTYSQIYNSVGSDKDKNYFRKPRLEPIKIEQQQIDDEETVRYGRKLERRQQIVENASKSKMEQKRSKEKMVLRDRNKDFQIPMFYIKLPQHFKQQRIEQKKKNKQNSNRILEEKLQEIYSGKFKIIRNM